jgi:type IV secretory pathway VirB10-like protein
MDENRNTRYKRLAIILAVSAGFSTVAYGVWRVAQNETTKTVEAPRPAPAQMFDPIPAEPVKVESVVGELVVAPSTLAMGTVTIGEGSFAGSFSVRAEKRPILIKRVSISFAQQTGISIDASRCADRTLGPDETCTVDVIFDPANPIRVDKQIVIQADSDNSDGSKKALDRHVTLNGEAVRPPPPPERTIVQAPVAPVAAPEPDNPALTAYLQNRTNLGGFSNQVSVGPQSPEVDSWSEVGFARSMSTFPSDLTRVVTMDKPIPAVLKIGIDTRFSNRAIAQVERDIYGGEGRLIVIPRGSVVTGTVGSSGSTGEEKVQISWTRIMRPDGAVFAIEAYGGDAMGRPGAPADIDNRYLERYGMSLLTTVMNVGLTVGLDGKQTVQNSSGGYSSGSGGTSYGGNAVVQQDARAVATQQANQYLQGVTNQLQQEGQQIAPIRTVPPGTRLTIFPNKDLFLKPIDPTKEMRQKLIAAEQERLRQGNITQAASSPTAAVTAPRTTQSAPAVTAPQADVTYDPITGQPILRQTAAPQKPLLDANGFPILPGNLGMQPVTSVQPQRAQPSTLSSRPAVGSVLLDGNDQSASQLRQAPPAQPQSGNAPWQSIGR